MPLDSVPWFVGDGAVHSPSMARGIFYDAMGGAEGVSSIDALKVKPNSPNGGSVLVQRGSVALLNRYIAEADSFGEQMYRIRNTGDEPVALTATPAGAARSDLIVARIDDPEFGGTVPADRKVGPYDRLEVITGVPPTTTKFSELGRNYPGYALARIDRPANTLTVAPGNIVDLRRVARPRTDRTTLTSQPAVSEPMSSAAFKLWPATATHKLYVPTWATKAIVRAQVSQAWLNVGTATGQIRASIGGVKTQWSWYTHNSAVNGARFSAEVSDTVSIPAGLRGTTIDVLIEAMKASGNQSWTADNSSSTSIDVDFRETV